MTIARSGATQVARVTFTNRDGPFRLWRVVGQVADTLLCRHFRYTGRSVLFCDSTCNIPEERKSHHHHGGSLKSHRHCSKRFALWRCRLWRHTDISIRWPAVLNDSVMLPTDESQSFYRPTFQSHKQYILSCKRPPLTHTNTYGKTSIEIHFIDFDKQICSISKTCCIMCVFLPTKYHLSHNVTTFCPNYTHHFQKLMPSPQI